ncbi:MAG: hypothetical protein F6K54_06580 [Okeania sp. SIO3B5]|nr:hypothetical protein [Okeania sp. SIO3B5]NEO52769.1 hypothetical protein [Okeania sp. SIO3B5]
MRICYEVNKNLDLDLDNEYKLSSVVGKIHWKRSIKLNLVSCSVEDL